MLRLKILFFGVLVVCSPLVNAGESWISLFDGETLSGWKPAAHGKADYKVVDGAIQGTTADGSPNSFLASEKDYADFELEFEVLVDAELNSGVQIRSREKTEADIKSRGGKGQVGRFHGPQVEIEQSPGQAAYIYGEATGHGWLSPEPQQKPEAAHRYMKNGEWNKFRVVAVGPRIQTWINGHPVADLTHDGVYQTHAFGKIGLQVHGIGKGQGPYHVAWKNIRIRER